MKENFEELVEEALINIREDREQTKDHAKAKEQGNRASQTSPRL